MTDLTVLKDVSERTIEVATCLRETLLARFRQSVDNLLSIRDSVNQLADGQVPERGVNGTGGRSASTAFGNLSCEFLTVHGLLAQLP